MLNRKMKKYVFVSGPLMCENCSFKARTTDVQRGNSLHCTAKNSIPIFLDISDLCLHWVSVVRVQHQ